MRVAHRMVDHDVGDVSSDGRLGLVPTGTKAYSEAILATTKPAWNTSLGMITNTKSVASKPAELLSDYRPPTGTFDELVDNTGAIRPHWAPLIAAFDGLPSRERRARARRLDRQVSDTGLAHDIYADPSAPPQQWRLNLMPFIISTEEWKWLEKALVQRAQLFNVMLGDIYGPQKLLRSGLLPPGLVFAGPAD